MRIPEKAPTFAALLESLSKDTPRIFVPPLTAEVDGRYRHWDDLRRRNPPPGLTHDQWWFRLLMARAALRVQLPLQDKEGASFAFARSDSLQRALHTVDRELGNQLELGDSSVANPETRDRYIIRSLVEEAITSSQLEGASTTRGVAKEMLMTGRAPRDRGERMIANNFRVMELVRSRRSEPLTRDFILELHEVLTAGTFDSAADVGRFRKGEELISVQDAGDGEVLHIPPPASELPRRIEALCRFANANADDVFIHPVVRAIALHFQLAYDHPFVDGNGRTARALFYWAMLRNGYWMTEFLSISRIIQKGRSRYSRAFLYTETDSADVTYFLLHQLEVIRQAVEDLHAYLRRKTQEVRAAERLIKSTENLNQRQQLLLAHALRHPDARYSIDAYGRENGVVYATARSDLLGLAAAGYLEQRKIGRRFYFLVSRQLEGRLSKRER